LQLPAHRFLVFQAGGGGGDEEAVYSPRALATVGFFLGILMPVVGRRGT